MRHFAVFLFFFASLVLKSDAADLKIPLPVIQWVKRVSLNLKGKIVPFPKNRTVEAIVEKKIPDVLETSKIVISSLSNRILRTSILIETKDEVQTQILAMSRLIGPEKGLPFQLGSEDIVEFQKCVEDPRFLDWVKETFSEAFGCDCYQCYQNVAEYVKTHSLQNYAQFLVEATRNRLPIPSSLRFEVERLSRIQLFHLINFEGKNFNVEIGAQSNPRSVVPGTAFIDKTQLGLDNVKIGLGKNFLALKDTFPEFRSVTSNQYLFVQEDVLSPHFELNFNQVDFIILGMFCWPFQSESIRTLLGKLADKLSSKGRILLLMHESEDCAKKVSDGLSTQVAVAIELGLEVKIIDTSSECGLSLSKPRAASLSNTVRSLRI